MGLQPRTHTQDVPQSPYPGVGTWLTSHINIWVLIFLCFLVFFKFFLGFHTCSVFSQQAEHQFKRESGESTFNSRPMGTGWCQDGAPPTMRPASFPLGGSVPLWSGSWVILRAACFCARMYVWCCCLCKENFPFLSSSNWFLFIYRRGYLACEFATSPIVTSLHPLTVFGCPQQVVKKIPTYC